MALFWFRNDLRLNDNEALTTALAEQKHILPVYILDERYLQRDKWGFLRMGAYRLQFLLESLHDLQDHLREKGGDLYVACGIPEELLPQLAQQFGTEQIYASKQYTHEELKVEKALQEQLSCQWFHQTTLVHPDDVPFTIDKLPEVFTAFRKKVEKYSEYRDPLPTPTQVKVYDFKPTDIPTLPQLGYNIPNVDKRRAIDFKGGATAAWNRLDHYFWNTESLSEYKETRNGLIGADYSSKFSAWLAHGCISARAINDEVNKYEDEIEKNKSTYWLIFELLWRDFFQYTAMRYGRSIFFQEGIKGREKKWRNSRQQFRKWQLGQTGDEFVDANMQELLRTGFMSNRGRQNVGSYLVHQLGEDWRKGAAWFESILVDYDVCSNWGNWMYVAGVGNDPRDRVFNTQKQAGMYDKDRAFRDLWLDNDGQASEEEVLSMIQQRTRTAVTAK